MGMNYLNWKLGKKGEKSAIAQDESLAEHDKKYHPDGFDPKKDECKLRETMAAEGKKDDLESGEEKGFKVGDKVEMKEGSVRGEITDVSKANGGLVRVSWENGNETWEKGSDVKDSGEKKGEDAKEDAEYMEAVKNGDMETAERMVREAAAKTDYNTFAYHGTKGEFTVFDKNKIGSENDEGWLGRGFNFWSESNLLYAYQFAGTKGKVMRVYLKVQEPYVIEREEIESLIDASDRHDTEYISSFTENLKDNGYDSVISDDGQILVFDPNSIKSADPVTYDDAGKVIPLSKRFDSKSNDIRF